MLFRIHFGQISIIQLFFFLSLLFFQSYYDYSMAQSSTSNEIIDDLVIETIDKLNVIAPEIDDRDLIDFKNPVSFSPGVQLLLNSDNQEIFVKATVNELVRFYAYYEALNYLYETDKINLIKFIYKDNLSEIIQKNIENLENLITSKILTLYSNTEEELKSAVNTLFKAISNIEHSEAKFLMTPLIKKINEKIINKSQEDYFDFETENIINFIQTQSNEVINAEAYEKGSREWWAVIGGIVVGAFVLATIGAFFIGLAGLSAWYYTPNIKTAKFCAQSLIKIYDMWPFIQKPSSHYIFPNSVVANIAFLDGNYEECLQLCDEWIENAQAEDDNGNDEKANRATADVCEAKILKSRAFAKLKRYSEAELLITSTIPYYTLLGQKHIPFMYLGQFFKQQGNTFLAKTNLKIAAEHKPLFGAGVNQFIAFYEYADMLDQMGDGAKALEFYKKADKACKVPWSPPSNKAIGREYRTLIDEAWTIQVSVSEETTKEDIPVEQIILAPNKTAIVNISGIHLDGSRKRIYADKLDIDIPFNAGFVVQEKYQSGNSVIVKFKCKDSDVITKGKINTVIKYDSGDFNKIRNFYIVPENEILKINKKASTRFFVLRDDIEEQEIEIKIVYSLHLPDGPVKNTLVLEIKDENDNIVFKDENLPLISGNNIEYVWDGFFNQGNKKQSIVPEEYNIFLLYTGAIGGTIEENILFHAVKVTPYIDKNYSIPLTDWKNDEKVSPRYLFGQTNPIYTKIEGWREGWFGTLSIKSSVGQDESIILDITAATSEFIAENFFIDKETDTLNFKIKVENEDYLTFILGMREIPQDNPIYYEGYNVKIDRAEYRTWWNEYTGYESSGSPTYPPDFDLTGSVKPCADSFESLQNIIPSAFQWEKEDSFNNFKNLPYHFINSIDQPEPIDNYDLVYWGGHANVIDEAPAHGATLYFMVKPKHIHPLNRNILHPGDYDTEWIIYDCCHFLRASEYIATPEKGRYLIEESTGVTLEGFFNTKEKIIENILPAIGDARIAIGFKTVQDTKYFDWGFSKFEEHSSPEPSRGGVYWHTFFKEVFIDKCKKGIPIIEAWTEAFKAFHRKSYKKNITRIIYLKDALKDRLVPEKEGIPIEIKYNASNQKGIDRYDLKDIQTDWYKIGEDE